MGDEAQLVRVACNLIDNAVNHTPDGGRVDVRLELLEDVRVSDGDAIGEEGIGAGERVDVAASNGTDVGAAASQGAATGIMRFSVRDTGPGIAPDELEHVWERYFTKKQAARNARGSGFGLAISREILEAHSARYGAESELGEGSTFWFEKWSYLQEV